jgi:hypothetical protein
MSLIAVISEALVGGAAAAASKIAASELENAYQAAKSLMLNSIGFELDVKKSANEVEDAIQKMPPEDLYKIEAIANDIAEHLDRFSKQKQKTIGVNASDIKADLAKFGNVAAKDGGIGVQIERGTFGTIEFGDVDAEGKKNSGRNFHCNFDN